MRTRAGARLAGTTVSEGVDEQLALVVATRGYEGNGQSVRLQGAGFALEAGAAIGIAGDVGRQHVDRHVARQPPIQDRRGALE